MSNELIIPGRLDEGQVDQGFDLRETLSFIWRQWKFVGAITIVAFLIGTLLLLRETPLYTATNQVLLDRLRDRPPGGAVLGADYSDVDLAMVESQMAIIQSTVLLRRVVEKEHLAAEPAERTTPTEPTAYASFLKPAVSYLLSLIGSSWAGQSNPEPDPAPVIVGTDSIAPDEMRAIGALKGSLKVSRVSPEGYVLAISFTSPDRARAARLANAIADAYLV